MEPWSHAVGSILLQVLYLYTFFRKQFSVALLTPVGTKTEKRDAPRVRKFSFTKFTDKVSRHMMRDAYWNIDEDGITVEPVEGLGKPSH